MVTKHRTGYVFKRGRNYYIQFMVDGRRVKQVLRDSRNRPITTAEEAEARQKEIMAPMMVAEREEALRIVRHRLDDTTQERQAIEAQTDPDLPLATAWAAYVASVNRPDSGPRTLEGYASQWRLFLAWLRVTHPVVSTLRQV